MASMLVNSYFLAKERADSFFLFFLLNLEYLNINLNTIFVFPFMVAKWSPEFFLLSSAPKSRSKAINNLKQFSALYIRLHIKTHFEEIANRRGVYPWRVRTSKSSFFSWYKYAKDKIESLSMAIWIGEKPITDTIEYWAPLDSKSFNMSLLILPMTNSKQHNEEQSGQVRFENLPTQKVYLEIDL